MMGETDLRFLEHNSQRGEPNAVSVVSAISTQDVNERGERDSSFPSMPAASIAAVQRLKRRYSYGYDGDNHYDRDKRKQRKLTWHAEPNREKQKRILLLGEGPMYYAVALLTKHPEVASQLLVTEFRSEQQLIDIYGQAFTDNLQWLRARQVEVRFGIDARHIHVTFAGYSFYQIHFNAPYGDAKEEGSREAVSQLCKDFFASCAQLQKDGQKIYLALPDPENPEKRRQYAETYQLAMRMGSHMLHKKRAFKQGDSLRYPGYQHVQTSCAIAAKVTENMMELVFVKRLHATTSHTLDALDREHVPSSALSVPLVTREDFFSQVTMSQGSTQYDVCSQQSTHSPSGSPPFTFSPVLRAHGSPALFASLPPLRLLGSRVDINHEEHVTGMQGCRAVVT